MSGSMRIAFGAGTAAISIRAAGTLIKVMGSIGATPSLSTLVRIVNGALSTWTPEEQQITVGVLELESPQPIVRVVTERFSRIRHGLRARAA
jgi:hypothetical protein